MKAKRISDDLALSLRDWHRDEVQHLEASIAKMTGCDDATTRWLLPLLQEQLATQRETLALAEAFCQELPNVSAETRRRTADHAERLIERGAQANTIS